MLIPKMLIPLPSVNLLIPLWAQLGIDFGSRYDANIG